jgi:hypothetical protein
MRARGVPAKSTKNVLAPLRHSRFRGHDEIGDVSGSSFCKRFTSIARSSRSAPLLGDVELQFPSMHLSVASTAAHDRAKDRMFTTSWPYAGRADVRLASRIPKGIIRAMPRADLIAANMMKVLPVRECLAPKRKRIFGRSGCSPQASSGRFKGGLGRRPKLPGARGVLPRL